MAALHLKEDKTTNEEKSSARRRHSIKQERLAECSYRHRKQRIAPPALRIKSVQSAAFRKDQVDAGRAYNPTKYGNEIALNVAKAHRGKGERSCLAGAKDVHGPVNPGNSAPARDILSAFGPRKSKG